MDNENNMELPKDLAEYEKALKFAREQGFNQGSRKNSTEKLIIEHNWSVYELAEALEGEREESAEKIERLEKEIADHTCSN